jgi:hypothetical protein
MGIWPLYSDGTDINAIDVNNEKGIVITANDDGGLVRLFNYPCVVKNAPAKEYTGHSSHVTNIKFIKGGDTMITTGGNDAAAMIFDVIMDTEAVEGNGFGRKAGGGGGRGRQPQYEEELGGGGGGRRGSAAGRRSGGGGSQYR